MADMDQAVGNSRKVLVCAITFRKKQ